MSLAVRGQTLRSKRREGSVDCWVYVQYSPCFLPCVLNFRKELIAKLDQAEKEKLDAAQLVREFEALTEENQTLKMAQSQCVEQLEKLRIQYQKRQGSS